MERKIKIGKAKFSSRARGEYEGWYITHPHQTRGPIVLESFQSCLEVIELMLRFNFSWS